MKTLEYNTTAVIGGVEHDVLVHYAVGPPEPDVGWAGELEIHAVWFEDEGDIQEQMSPEELEALIEQLPGDEPDPDLRADYEYDRMVDDKLTGDW